MTANGKGDNPRPINGDKYRKNYDNIMFKPAEVEHNVNFNKGAIEIETKSSERRQQRDIKIIKEYIDRNGVEMVIVNIDGSFSNKTITKNTYKILVHDVVDESRLESENQPGEDK